MFKRKGPEGPLEHLARSARGANRGEGEGVSYRVIVEVIVAVTIPKVCQSLDARKNAIEGDVFREGAVGGFAVGGEAVVGEVNVDGVGHCRAFLLGSS